MPKYYHNRNIGLLRARLSFIQSGFFVLQINFSNFFEKSVREFGSFAILTVLVAKGENITCLCRSERG